MELRSEQSKEYLAEALLELMKKKPFAKIKIQDITDKAGLSHMAYYRNFSSKEDIVVYYLDTITDKFITESNIIRYNNKDDFRKFIGILFSHLISVKEIALLLYQNNLFHHAKKEFDRILVRNAASTSEKYNAYFISGGLYNIYYYWLLNHCQESAEQLSDIFVDFSYPNKK